MLPRFFVPDLDPAALEAVLPEDEAAHLMRVLRLGAGDEITVFDGRGHACHARVTSAARNAVRIAILAPSPSPPEPRVPITLAQAVLKGEKMEQVVRDATMMGAAAIVPILTSRTVVPARAAHAAGARWVRVTIASAKQCGRAVLPGVSEPRTLEDWIAGDRAALKLLLVEPSASNGDRAVRDPRDLPAPKDASLLIGPEGGWAPGEIDTAVKAGCVPITLGRRTLRADAVPTAALSILQFLWGDL